MTKALGGIVRLIVAIFSALERRYTGTHEQDVSEEYHPWRDGYTDGVRDRLNGPH